MGLAVYTSWWSLFRNTKDLELPAVLLHDQGSGAQYSTQFS